MKHMRRNLLILFSFAALTTGAIAASPSSDLPLATAPAPAPAPAPNPAQAAATTPASAAPEANAEALKLDLNAELKALGEWHGSFMFSMQDQDRIRLARENIGKKIDPLVAQQGGTPGAPGQPVEEGPPPAAPNFYLGSIVYVSAKDWTIWLNGKRIRPDHKEPSLKVDVVTPEYIDVTWKDAALKRIVPDAAQRAAKAAADSEQPVRVDEAQGIVRFRLTPYQTFVAFDMAVVQGKVAPVVQTEQVAGDLTDGRTQGRFKNRAQTAEAAPAPSPAGQIQPGTGRDPKDITNQLMQNYEKASKLVPAIVAPPQ